ncbi:hypothetical protein RUND412_007059 [Rhizina undulata]
MKARDQLQQLKMKPFKLVINIHQLQNPSKKRFFVTLALWRDLLSTDLYLMARAQSSVDATHFKHPGLRKGEQYLIGRVSAQEQRFINSCMDSIDWAKFDRSFDHTKDPNLPLREPRVYRNNQNNRNTPILHLQNTTRLQQQLVPQEAPPITGNTFSRNPEFELDQIQTQKQSEPIAEDSSSCQNIPSSPPEYYQRARSSSSEPSLPLGPRSSPYRGVILDHTRLPDQLFLLIKGRLMDMEPGRTYDGLPVDTRTMPYHLFRKLMPYLIDLPDTECTNKPSAAPPQPMTPLPLEEDIDGSQCLSSEMEMTLSSESSVVREEDPFLPEIADGPAAERSRMQKENSRKSFFERREITAPVDSDISVEDSSE